MVKERASCEMELPVPVATIEEALQQIGLTELGEKLKAEQMDMDSLVRMFCLHHLYEPITLSYCVAGDVWW